MSNARDIARIIAALWPNMTPESVAVDAAILAEFDFDAVKAAIAKFRATDARGWFVVGAVRDLLEADPAKLAASAWELICDAMRPSYEISETTRAKRWELIRSDYTAVKALDAIGGSWAIGNATVKEKDFLRKRFIESYEIRARRESLPQIPDVSGLLRLDGGGKSDGPARLFG